MISRSKVLVGGLIAYCFAINAFASYGRTAGQFAVAQTGSAQYSLPIWAPPGIRGLKPELALTYDSHATYGLMGPGWMLSGLSSIARCNPTFAQDGAAAPITLTSADGLCLDGNRLRAAPSGQSTTYQTEIANFSLTTAGGVAGNGPSYFTVQGKDGLTYEYGNTTDSKIFPSGSTTPYIWALDKVTDRSGNTMKFTYYQSAGSYVPLSIQYAASNGSSTYPYKINFTYATKSSNDTATKYIAGSQVQQTNQLSTITVTSSGTTVREYKLLYTTSSATLRATLTSIQECGGSGGTDCLAATSVGYQYGSAGIVSPATASGSGATNGTVYSVDIDGDGKQDLVYAVSSGSNYAWWVQFATPTGYGAPIYTGAVTIGTNDLLIDDFDATGDNEILAPASGIWYAYKWNATSQLFTATSTGVAVVTSGLAAPIYSSADVDGDGRPDLVSFKFGGTLSIQLNTTVNGVISFASTPTVVNSGIPAFGAIALVGDNQLPASSVKHYDFDGDGRADLLLSYQELVGGQLTSYSVVYALLSRGNGAFVLQGMGTTFTPSQVFLAVNWNDDACTDLAAGAYVYIAQCNGSLGVSVSLPAAASVALDWDGDGRTDVLANVGGTWEVYRSQGNTVAPGVSTGIHVGSGSWIVTDQDGDGLHDLVFSNSAAGNALYYGLHNGAGIHPDLATSFTDGYGYSVQLSYQSIAFGYGGCSVVGWASYPYRATCEPIQIVPNVYVTDPNNAATGTYRLFYSFGDAELNLQGRGFAGFAQFYQGDERNNTEIYDYYDIQFPYTRMLGTRYIQNDNSGGYNNVFESDHTVNVTTLDSTANNQRYFPYYSNITEYATEPTDRT